MPGQKRSQRIANGAFSYVVGPDQNFQPGVKFQFCVTQHAEVFMVSSARYMKIV